MDKQNLIRFWQEYVALLKPILGWAKVKEVMFWERWNVIYLIIGAWSSWWTWAYSKESFTVIYLYHGHQPPFFKFSVLLHNYQLQFFSVHFAYPELDFRSTTDVFLQKKSVPFWERVNYVLGEHKLFSNHVYLSFVWTLELTTAEFVEGVLHYCLYAQIRLTRLIMRVHAKQRYQRLVEG